MPADLTRFAGKGGSVEKAPFKTTGRGFLPDQPDRARVGGDGGMLPPGLRADADGSGVSVT